jgi:hypothetical protein
VAFLDNDIILKLVACQLLDDAITALNLTKSDLRVLPTARFVFKGKRDQGSQYPDCVWAEAIEFVESCATANYHFFEKDSLDELQQLAQFKDDIQEGEAALIVATRLEPDFLLLSGDKRCIKALASIPQPIYRRLCGQVICLEQLILKLLYILEFESLQSKVLPMAECD